MLRKYYFKERLQMKKSIYVKGLFLGLIAGILWGITGPLGQYLFDEKGVVPDWLVPCRLFVSGAVILMGLYMKRKSDIFRLWTDRKDAIHMVIYSIAGMMAVQYSFFVAVEASNGGTATVLQYTNPVMIIIYFAVFRKVRPSGKEVFAVLLALTGIFLLSTNGNIHTLVITPRGLLMGLMCAFFTCLYSMIPGRLLEKYDAVLVSGWSMLVGGIVLAFWRRPWTVSVGGDFQVWGLFLILVFAGTIIPFIASLKAIPVIGPMYANVLASVEPVVASLITFLALGTQFGRFELVGFALIITTIIILSWKKEET